MSAPAEGFAAIPRSLLMDPEAPWAAKLVYAALSGHAGSSADAWPKQATMAEYLGICERQVRRALAWLREHQYVTWQSTIVGGMRTINNYTLLVSSRPVKADRTDSPVREVRPDSQSGPESRDRTTSPVRFLGDTSKTGPDCQSSQEKEELKSLKPSSRRTATAADMETRDDLNRIANHLADRMADNDPDGKRPGVGKRWLNDVRLLLDVDKRTEEQVHTAIDWCQDHDWWKSRILSPANLRKHYAAMRLQATEQRGRPLRSVPDTPLPVENPMDRVAAWKAQQAQGAAASAAMRASR